MINYYMLSNNVPTSDFRPVSRRSGPKLQRAFNASSNGRRVTSLKDLLTDYTKRLVEQIIINKI